MTRNLLLFNLLLFVNFTYSQDTLKDNKSHFVIEIEEQENRKTKLLQEGKLSSFFANTNLNILFGATQFFGDIKQWDNIPAFDKNQNFFEIKPSVEISLNKKINQLFSIQTSVIIGSFAGIKRVKIGSDYETHDPYFFYQGQGEYFQTDYKELDLQFLLDLSNASSFFSTIKNKNLTIYLKGGLGINVFNSVNRNLVSGDYIYSYGYEDENQFGGNIKKSIMQSPKETVYIIGLNTRYELNNKLSILLDATKRKVNSDFWDTHDNKSKEDNFNFYSLGLSYRIGGRLKEKNWRTPLESLEREVQASKANIEWLSEDSDNDGVSDAFDKELNTPMGVSVDGSGVSLDVDMDNIPDYLDSDPFSSRGAIVDGNGVEFDSDNDGISDSKDLESNTKIGSIVNQYGITVTIGTSISNTEIHLPSIYFTSGSYFINSSNLRRIATIAIMMNNNPEIRLNVIGNTDKNGSTNSNQNLALKRSQEVINYLSENFGIEKKRFESSSNGEENNLATEITSLEFPNNNTLSEINRRVDFQIID
jgi:outer membrane protein OmpA-like peptidoglycan-associated protein